MKKIHDGWWLPEEKLPPPTQGSSGALYGRNTFLCALREAKEKARRLGSGFVFAARTRRKNIEVEEAGKNH